MCQHQHARSDASCSAPPAISSTCPPHHMRANKCEQTHTWQICPTHVNIVHCYYYCSCLPPSVPYAVCMSLVLPWQLVATMLRQSQRRLCHALMAQGHTAPSLTDTSTAATSNSLLPASLSAFINGPTAGVPSTQLGQTPWPHKLQRANVRPTGACNYSMASWIQQRALITSTTSNSSSSEDKPSGSGRSQPPPSVAAAATASSSFKARRGSQATGVRGDSPGKPVWLHIIMRKRK